MRKKALSLFLALTMIVGLLSGLTVAASADTSAPPSAAVWNVDNTAFSPNDTFCIGQTYTFTSYATTYDASASPTTTYYDHSWTYTDGDPAINLTDGGTVSWANFAFSQYWGSGWEVTFTPQVAGTYTINIIGSDSHASDLSYCTSGDPDTTYGTIEITVVDKTVSVYRENDVLSDAMSWYAGNTYNLSAYVYDGSYNYTEITWAYSAIDSSWTPIDLSSSEVVDVSSDQYGCYMAFSPAEAGTYTFVVQSPGETPSTYKIIQFTVLPAAQYNLTFEGTLYSETSTAMTSSNAAISVTMVNGATTDFSDSLTETLAAGDYTYTVSAEGYVAASGSLTLSADATQPVSLFSTAMADTLKNNIATAYSSDASNYWRVVGLMALANDAYTVSSEDTATLVANAIDVFSSTDTYSATPKAMNMIALTALGYDVSQVIDSGVTYSAYDTLATQLAADTTYYGWTEIYAYSLMAFLQGSDTVRADYDDQINTCISALTPDGAGSWSSYGFSADSAGIALAALCMARDKGYTTVDDSVIQDLVWDLEGALTKEGNYTDSYYNTANANSTALAIIGLDAAGVDVSSLTAYGYTTTLLSGLLSFAADSTGFSFSGSSVINGSATEQGFLALIAAADSADACVFDFSGNGTSLTESSAHYYTDCPVIFSIIPSSATVTVVSGESVISNVGLSGRYDLPAGNYTYTVSASGYNSKTGSITVSEDDAANLVRKNISVSLSSSPVTDNTITVKLYVKIHDADQSNTYTYKDNASAYHDIVSETVTLSSGSTVFDALDAALTEADVSYAESSPGYIRTIDGLSEMDYGQNSGWLYRVGSITATIGSRDYELTRNSTVIWFFTDDYSSEYGSESWSGADTTTTDTKNALTAGSNGAASIDAAAMTDIISAGKGFSVKATAGSVALTSAGASALKDIAGSDGALTVSITAATAAGSGFTVVSDGKTIASLDISIKLGDTKITSGFGVLTITADVGDTYAGQTLSILHLHDDGTYEILNGTVDKDGILSFDTTTLSTFVVFAASALPAQYIFSDVGSGAWYESYVRYVYGNGIMTGTTDTTFSPDVLMSRAMLVTVLWRMDGESTSSQTSDFTDVSDSTSWYYNAVAWGAENGIIGGYGNGTFGPSDNVTREQLVTIFYRYAQYKDYGTGTNGDMSLYSDANNISSWALPAFRWAVANGIISGTTTSTISPLNGASRCQTAAIIERFAENAPLAAPADETVSAAYDKTAAYYIASGAPGFGGEWEIIGLCEGGYTLPEGYLSSYYDGLCAYLTANDGVLSSRKYTEYSRVVYALTTAGYDATDVAGYDLTAPLGDYDATLYQGINGPIWALIALDCGSYENSLRQDYIDLILSRELANGGWTLSGTVADADITAMALCGLAPYTGNADVAAAVARGITALSNMQNDDGGFSSGNIATSESCAQVVRALCTLNITPDDARFVKNGVSAMDCLLTYQLSDGSFAHTLGGGANYTATQQAFYALAAAK